MTDTNSNSGGGGHNIGFLDLLAVAFIVLKLLGVVRWSWWWVLSPIWIPAIFAVIVLIVALFVGDD